MPDPTGCYIMVFDGPDFTGTREFINGPRRYPTLTRMPFGANWSQRIRSIQVGLRASVTLWADTTFRGSAQVLRRGSKQPMVLSDDLAEGVESLAITCFDVATPEPFEPQE